MTKDQDAAGMDPQRAAKELLDRYFEVGQRIQHAWHAIVRREMTGDDFTVADPVIIGKAFAQWWLKAASDPSGLIEAQNKAWADFAALWTAVLDGEFNDGKPVIAAPERSDRRFADKSWDRSTAYNVVKQSYLITSNWIMDSAARVKGLDDATRRKVLFYTRQYVDAMAPTNFIATNPQVLKATVESHGRNLFDGLDNLATDIERGHGRLDIAMTDYTHFRLGENVATTPGKVIYQNDLIQLIQYTPTTEQAYRRPLLIVPPWINKYYVLDLQPKNSFIKWVVGQGHTTFVISWVNPTTSLKEKSFEHYLLEGPLSALGAIERATGETDVNILGYCIGGTLTSITLAYLAARQDSRVKSATFLTSMIDFAEPGELGVFIDEQQLTALEHHMEEKGYLEGHHMAQVFNLMRDKELIWSFVVNNYLLGRQPLAFDLLYWNADSTRMPARMHGFYLRKMYQENKLIEPGGIVMNGVPIDLRRVDIPTYLLSTEQDHIAPWRSTYAATQIYSGSVRFVLSTSGHIAGVINPPAAKKYAHSTNSRNPPDPSAWKRGATKHDGSWWPDWARWIARRGGGKVPAREPGDGELPPLEDAPGSYVKVRVMD